MSLFTKRDRTAITLIMVLIVAGWGIRSLRDRDIPRGPTVHRRAVEVPAALDSAGTGEYLSSPIFAPIDINTASPGELELLPMIGPARAAAIVEYRETNGPFESPQDIRNVPGIGQGIFEQIRSHITSSGQTYDAAPTDGDGR